MKQYRVLLTCEAYLPHIGGAEICVHNLRRELLRAGHRPVVFTNTVSAIGSEEGIVRLPWRFSPVDIVRNIHALWRLIGDSDIVHCQYSYRIACICAVICRLRNVPMVLTQQGKGIVPEANTRLHHLPLLRLCQHVSMKGASIITSTSDEITDLTAEFVPNSKIVSVSNGFDSDLFSPDSSVPVPPEFAHVPSSVSKILTVRRIVPKNGIHILVQALALVREQREDFCYFAIGDGPYQPYVEELIQKHDLQQHVRILGGRANDSIKPYYQHADLVIVPSSAEATSIACIEAMGMEKPLIASRVGGLIDLLGVDSSYGTLVSIYGSEACTYNPPPTLPREQLQPLASAILAFLADRRPFMERAKKARLMVEERYSWRFITGRYLDIYHSFLSR